MSNLIFFCQVLVSIITVMSVSRGKVFKERIYQHYSWPKTMMAWVMTVATFFPAHFLTISVATLNSQIRKEEEKAQDCITTNNSKSELNEDGPIPYAKLKTSVDEMEKDYKEVANLKTLCNMLRTIIEHLPSAVIMLSLWMMSINHSALKMFLINGFLEQFSAYYKWIILAMSIKIAFSSTSSVISSRYTYTLFSWKLFKQISLNRLNLFLSFQECQEVSSDPIIFGTNLPSIHGHVSPFSQNHLGLSNICIRPILFFSCFNC